MNLTKYSLKVVNLIYQNTWQLLNFLPDLGEIEIFDYDTEITVSHQQSLDVLESLVDLYLSDVPQLKEHPYIRNKMREDASVYAEAVVDNSDNSARMHEVINQTISQIRENAKFVSNQRTELEKFYKNLRKDMGYNEIENPEIKKAEELKQEEQTGEEGAIMDNRKLNDMIKNAMTQKKD